MKVIILCFVTLLMTGANAQTYFDFTTAANRAKHDNDLKEIIKVSLQQPLSAATEGQWEKAFWAMELMLYKTSFTKEKLTLAWKMAPALSENFQKALLEVSYTLYPSSFDKQINGLLIATKSPAVFIRCAEYLMLTKSISREKIKSLLQQSFNKNDFTGFKILEQRLSNNHINKRPPLQDIFSKNFLPGQTLIYSLQRQNRNYAGLVLIRKADGTFVKEKDGTLFHTAQLARAITNYPFYITNGNTPQGIFKWTGFDSSSNSYIGPATNLQMVMPYETSPAVFFGDRADSTSTWSQQSYAALLPASWKDYNGMYESFFAGAMGRSEVIMHGTTINPDYYKDQKYFPQTPSLGCLCSYEEWNKEGKRVVSNQQKIVTSLQSIRSKSGYVIVIELDDNNKAVTLQDVNTFIY